MNPVQLSGPSSDSEFRFEERRQDYLTAKTVNEILIYQKQGGSLENRMIAAMLATLAPDIQHRIRSETAVFRKPGVRS